MNYNNLSMIYFASMKRAVVVTPENATEINPAESSLPNEGLFLSNLGAREISVLPFQDEDKRRILASSDLVVNPSYIAKELGVDLGGAIEASDASTLKAVLQGYKSALYRLRFSIPMEGRRVRRELIESIKERTMADDFKSAICEGVKPESIKPSVHSWVETGSKLPKNFKTRVVHLDRGLFYYFLLNQDLPVNVWKAGDPSLPLDIILKSSEGHGAGFLAEGSHSHDGDLPFISGCTTSVKRNHYLPVEIVNLQEEGSSFNLSGWWRGEMTKPRSPFEGCNEISLGDSLLMEMIYKAWRSDGLLGYWIAATERLIIHGVAELLSDKVIVLGYGSGKLAIATPDDAEGAAEQDKYLLKFRDECFLRIPISQKWSARQLCTFLPLLSDMQKIAATWADGLSKIDRALDAHSYEELDFIKSRAIKALEERIS